ncbi:DUF421 domain-containing protein [Bacillus piscicola]|uniref:DUF421 domain-containing protein n=1 Tax=Bacillus piscicola TaxID=1632684 RepID=UPI001F08BA63|nr:DUF421 domain-containing protein [Bacillus piscicola]
MPAWLEVASRAFLFLVLLFVIAKLAGKKHITDFSFFDFVIAIAVGTITGITTIGLETSVLEGIIGVAVFGLIPILISLVLLKSKTARENIEGEAAVLIKDGKILEDNLKTENMTTDKLLESLRKKDVFQVADVEFATLEPSGGISVLLKKENQPLTAKDLGVTVPGTKEPQTVIMDGEIFDEPLATVGLNRRWLKTELEKLGVTVENVFIGQVDSYGQLTVDLFDDKLEQARPVEKPQLLAVMKKCQADLENFALATEADDAKKMYEKNSKLLQSAIEKVTPYLRG